MKTVRMRNIVFGILFLFGIIGLIQGIGFADTELSPHTFTLTSKDKRYIFVMRVVEDIETYRLCGRKQPCVVSSEQAGLAALYPQSGLYRNDITMKLVWPVDWYAHQIFLSSDARYLVRMGPWPMRSPLRPAGNDSIGDNELQQLAVVFYDNGNQIKEYRIKDVIKSRENLPQSISHFMWYSQVEFDENTNRLMITTTDKEVCVFDITNGELVERKP